MTKHISIIHAFLTKEGNQQNTKTWSFCILRCFHMKKCF